MVRESVNNNCLNYTVKYGEGHMTIWGGFGGEKGFHKMTSTMNKNSYHSILVYHAIQSVVKNISQGFIFQQDNDPKHASKL